MLKIELITDISKVPFHLLLLADPSMEQVNQYVQSGKCYVARQGIVIIGVLVMDKIDTQTVEIKNIAIDTSYQGKGFAKQLLQFAKQSSKTEGFQKITIGTGNSSINQLALYQKQGFEIVRIEKDFFTNHYTEPIIENGILCKHMIILEQQIS